MQTKSIFDNLTCFISFICLQSKSVCLRSKHFRSANKTIANISKRYRVSRDESFSHFLSFSLSEGGKWIGVVCVRCLTRSRFSSLRAARSILKAIRHCRICQLRSSRRFWEICGNIESFTKISHLILILSSPRESLSVILEPPLVPSRLSSSALRSFRQFILFLLVRKERATRLFCLFRYNSSYSLFAILFRLIFFFHCDLVMKGAYHAPVRATKRIAKKKI